MRQRKLAVIDKECVACGNCVKYCPRQAIAINKGICAVVDKNVCVGCGRCEIACPAGAIAITAGEEGHA